MTDEEELRHPLQGVQDSWDKMTEARTLREALDIKCLLPNDLADILGVSRARMDGWCFAKSRIPLKFALEIAAILPWQPVNNRLQVIPDEENEK